MTSSAKNCLSIASEFNRIFEVNRVFVNPCSRRYSQLSNPWSSWRGGNSLPPLSSITFRPATPRSSALAVPDRTLFPRLSTLITTAPTATTTTRKTIINAACLAPIANVNAKRLYSSKVSKTMGVFRFSDYDCVGFDLDNTLLRYNVTNMVNLEYECLSKFLVEKRGYDPKYLYKPLALQDYDFMQKGLVLDFARGNVLRFSPTGTILRASHGTKILSEEELDTIYPDRRWNVTDAFTSDLLVTWNGPLSEQMRTLLDYFDMPASLAFAKIIDTIDENNGGNSPPSQYTVWPDVLDGLIDMFDRENFSKDDGKYFPSLKGNPDKYLHRSSQKLISWLKELKQTRVTYLITGSNADFANFTASYALGKDWNSLFDIVVCYAKKPGFFTGSRPFLKLDGYSEGEIATASELKRGGVYSQGNWKDLKEFFVSQTGKTSPSCLYVGDNLIQDIYTPKCHAFCDTVAVVEEQLAEGMQDHSLSHSDEQILNSKVWGSYFHIEGKNKVSPSLWSHVINNYSKICVPSVEFIAKNSLDTPMKSFGLEADRKLSGFYPGKPKSIVAL
ncbi:5'-nucleotidase domain-containing protein 1 [Diprion similis]|uniref:5'-nucleotidase domain-containing protein 1 n=1 Tax=Diprion similis TaxID=362088 RepID=UPI001EF932E1|nr:5'-nucleotidase domain-containing protein 1 [Diprion similis]